MSLGDSSAAPAPAPTARPDKVLALLAHPDLAQSRVHRSLLEALRQHGDERVLVRDLYALYPDFVIDVAAEQAVLSQVGLIAWLHPLHWYGMPPLLKLWMDEVLSYGWAYGPGGQALAGKDFWLVLSTGGSASSYAPEGSNRHAFDAFLPPYAQTSALLGLRFLRPEVFHGAHQASPDTVHAHARSVAERLRQWPHWPELQDWPACPHCEQPLNERPPARPLPRAAGAW